MDSRLPDTGHTSEGTWSQSLSTGLWRFGISSPGPLCCSPVLHSSFSCTQSTSLISSPPLPPHSPSLSLSLLPSPSTSVWSAQKRLSLGKVQKGTIVLVPKRGEVDPKSVVHSYQDFTARGAHAQDGFNHPAVVTNILPGGILKCLQVTSFAGRGADAKWHHGTGAQKRRALYLEIDHSNERGLDDEAVDDKGRPILRLTNRHIRMCQASFVNCDRTFNIESLNVFRYRNGSHQLQSRDLDRIQAYRSELLKQGLISDNTCSNLAATTSVKPKRATRPSTRSKH